MERPTLEHYRRVLREQGIELSEDELRALRDQVGRFAHFIVELYEEQRRTERAPNDD
jgi:hypothetical protein